MIRKHRQNIQEINGNRQGKKLRIFIDDLSMPKIETWRRAFGLWFADYPPWCGEVNITSSTNQQNKQQVQCKTRQLSINTTHQFFTSEKNAQLSNINFHHLPISNNKKLWDFHGFPGPSKLGLSRTQDLYGTQQPLALLKFLMESCLA